MIRFSSVILALVCATVNANSSDFWTWFKNNESDFPETAEFDATYGEALIKQLEKVKPGLAYEIATPAIGEKELVISANGLRDLIPDVLGLIETAPDLTGWTFTAFRPRMSGFNVTIGGHEFDPAELWCYSRVENGHFDLIIYHPEFSEDSRSLLTGGTYILLDMALGEYDVMTGIRYIDHRQLPPDPQAAGLYRFENLRKVFDNYKSNSGKSSQEK